MDGTVWLFYFYEDDTVGFGYKNKVVRAQSVQTDDLLPASGALWLYLPNYFWAIMLAPEWTDRWGRDTATSFLQWTVLGPPSIEKARSTVFCNLCDVRFTITASDNEGEPMFKTVVGIDYSYNQY